MQWQSVEVVRVGNDPPGNRTRTAASLQPGKKLIESETVISFQLHFSLILGDFRTSFRTESDGDVRYTVG